MLIKNAERACEERTRRENAERERGERTRRENAERERGERTRRENAERSCVSVGKNARVRESKDIQSSSEKYS
jgi:hypothetical protein